MPFILHILWSCSKLHFMPVGPIYVQRSVHWELSYFPSKILWQWFIIYVRYHMRCPLFRFSGNRQMRGRMPLNLLLGCWYRHLQNMPTRLPVLPEDKLQQLPQWLHLCSIERQMLRGLQLNARLLWRWSFMRFKLCAWNLPAKWLGFMPGLFQPVPDLRKCWHKLHILLQEVLV